MSKSPARESERLGRPRHFDDDTERRLLMDAAVRLMARNGFADMAVTDILAEAELSTTSFYRHFQSKHALLAAIIQRDGDSARRALERAIAAAPDPVAALEAWLDGLLAQFFEPRKASRTALFTTLDCFFNYLAQHSDVRRAIADDRENVPFIVEELLRWETPVMVVASQAKQDTELAGCPIHAGEQVLVMLGSANTDEKSVSEPESVRFDRKVNRHSGFGGGVHRCLGSHLARIELRTALRIWHERIPEYHIKPGVELDFTPGVRAVQTFPMILQAGAE